MKLKNGKEIQTRVLISHAKNARDRHNIDLGDDSKGGPAKRFNNCSLTLYECVYALFEKDLNEAGVNSIEELQEQIGTEELRKEVTPDIEGFFPLVETGGMLDAVLQNGDLMSKLLDQVGNRNREASGSTS